MYGFVYCATNIANGKRYVGQTAAKNAVNDPMGYLKRRYGHLTSGSNPHWRSALRKFGFDGFRWNILRECVDQQNIDDTEVDYIDLFMTLNQAYGYNCREGGRARGRCCKETKLRMSEAFRISWSDDNSRSRRIAVMNDERVKEKRKAAQRKAFSKPDVRLKGSKAQKEAQNRPDVKQRNIEMIKIVHNRPDVKQRKSLLMKGRKAFHDPVSGRYGLFKVGEEPASWHRGKK